MALCLDNGQTKHWRWRGSFTFFVSFLATVGFPTHLEGEGDWRDIHLGVVCNLTARCH